MRNRSSFQAAAVGAVVFMLYAGAAIALPRDCEQVCGPNTPCPNVCWFFGVISCGEWGECYSSVAQNSLQAGMTVDATIVDQSEGLVTNACGGDQSDNDSSMDRNQDASSAIVAGVKQRSNTISKANGSGADQTELIGQEK